MLIKDIVEQEEKMQKATILVPVKQAEPNVSRDMKGVKGIGIN